MRPFLIGINRLKPDRRVGNVHVDAEASHRARIIAAGINALRAAEADFRKSSSSADQQRATYLKELLIKVLESGTPEDYQKLERET